MKWISLLATFLTTTIILSGQISTPVLSSENVDQQKNTVSLIQLSEPEADFHAISAIWQGQADELFIRYSENNKDWTSFEAWFQDSHANPEVSGKISQLQFIDAKYRYIEVSATSEVESINLHVYDPGKTERQDENLISDNIEGRACPCPQPEYIDREGWCPNGDCPNNPNQPTTIPTHMIVHHSASPNSASDWAAVVRSFWDFHVNVNGWADIGYNWLIAPTGEVFEGRGDDIQGAHFGCSENPTGNINTAGICMIGTFSTETPTMEARNSLKQLLAWKTCDVDIDPEGISIHTLSGLLLDHISGHRQGCNTECPGNAFFPLLSDVREEVAAFIASGCSIVPVPTQLEGEGTLAGVELTWMDNTEDEVAFELERAKALPINFSLIATLDPNTTSYTDGTVDPNSGYYYRIRALTETDTSAFSNEEFVFTLATSTNNLFQEGAARLFPNPAQSVVWLELDNQLRGEMTVEILNVTNQVVVPKIVVDKQAETEQFKISLNNLPGGMYWLKVSHNTEIGMLPFVVE